MALEGLYDLAVRFLRLFMLSSATDRTNIVQAVGPVEFIVIDHVERPAEA